MVFNTVILHMLRGIGTVGNCAGLFRSPDTEQDYQEMLARYRAWARRVEDDGWAIATYVKAGSLWIPPDTLAHFFGLANAECDAMLSLRLLGRGDAGGFSCGNGIHPLEFITLINASNGEIVRSFHEAATKHALLANLPGAAEELLHGLAQRVEEGMAIAESGQFPSHMPQARLVDLLAHAAATGVPLTWREVRWVHQVIEKAHPAASTSRGSCNARRAALPGAFEGWPGGPRAALRCGRSCDRMG